MDTKYTYSISTDFPNHKVDPARLQNEIRASAIVTSLCYISTSGDDCECYFKADLSVGDKAILDATVAAHSGEPLVAPPEYKVDSDGRQVVVVDPQLDGAMVNIVSHDFCNKETWYPQSVAVSNESLADSGDGLSWGSAHPFWVDLNHGKVYLEDRISSSTYPNKIPVIKVDGVTMTARTPFTTSGGDYTIDYKTGVVTFAVSQAGKAVTASYRYATTSLFTIAPTAGKYLWVQDSEIQFSTDVTITSTVNFQAYMTNPADPGGAKIPASSLTNYKNMRDFVDEARGVHPLVPAIGGSIRGLVNPHLVFPFKYTQAKELRSSLGVEIRVWLSADVPYEGEFGTATFYCLSYAE